MKAINIVHFFINYRSLGGVQQVLRQHHDRDAHYGVQSRFIIYNEAEQQPEERIVYLGINGRMSIRAIHTKLDRSLGACPPDVALYHTAPIPSYICQADRAARRVVFLHGKGTGLDDNLLVRQAWFDGVISANTEACLIASRTLSHLGPERFLVVPLPLNPCPVPVRHLPLAQRPIVLGYSGRVMREHKRVDRLPLLCRQLETAGVDYRLEILGDGPDLAWLRSSLAGHPQVRFHGRHEGRAYWEILSGWDVILFLSDTEGQPLALLEALSAQVIPVFPKIGSGGDDYVRKVDERLLYPPGAVEAAAAVVASLARSSVEEITRLRTCCPLAVASNLGDGYFRQVASFLHRIQAAPRVSTDVFPAYPEMLKRLPLLVIRPLALFRRRVLQRLAGLNAAPDVPSR
jgi:glycosyltransferase involved in cell wall biosynthesis